MKQDANQPFGIHQCKELQEKDLKIKKKKGFFQRINQQTRPFSPSLSQSPKTKNNCTFILVDNLDTKEDRDWEC